MGDNDTTLPGGQDNTDSTGDATGDQLALGDASPPGDQAPPADGGDATGDQLALGDASPPKDQSGDADGADSQRPAGDQKAPEQYADFQYPEEFKLEADVEKTFSDKFRELNFSQEQAQSLMTTLAELSQKGNDELKAVFEQKAEQEKNERQQQVQSWVDELKTDANFGGARYEATLKDAQRAALHFGGPELIKVLNEGGQVNNPVIAKTLAKIGAAMGEDPLSTGGVSLTKTPPKAEDLLFPSHTK